MQTIYLDYNATTPVAPEVTEAMLPFFQQHFGNPSSAHWLGRAASEAIATARGRVAALLGADADEIVFTSGGTESNNLALIGALWQHGRQGGHLVISAIEHPAVAAPAQLLRDSGYDVTLVGCSSQGVVDVDQVADRLRPDTVLVSVMHANNEIGVVQPIEQLSQLCRGRGVLLHTDAAQSVGKIPTQVVELGVDLLTIAGHKMYAPKGVGALYVRRGVALSPVLRGADHEGGLRPGTENTPYLVGLGAAAALVAGDLDESSQRTASLRDRLQALLQQQAPGLVVHGQDAPRLPNTLSAAFPGVSGAQLLAGAAELCASTGSACHSGAAVVSPTLAAIGLSPAQAAGTVRLSVGRNTTAEQVERAASLLIDHWERLRPS